MLEPLKAHVSNHTPLGRAIEAMVKLEEARGEVRTALFDAKLEVKVDQKTVNMPEWTDDNVEILDQRTVSIFVTSPWGTLDRYDIEKIIKLVEVRGEVKPAAISIENSGIRLLF